MVLLDMVYGLFLREGGGDCERRMEGMEEGWEGYISDLLARGKRVSDE